MVFFTIMAISSVNNLFFNGQMELLIHCLFFIGIRELKLRQIEVNIIFGWSRQNSDEMAISDIQKIHQRIITILEILGGILFKEGCLRPVSLLLQ